MSIVEKLILLGFSEREARVYLALLHVGPTTTSRLIRETSIPSSKIYDVLERLEDKGFATYIISRGKKEFSATAPGSITVLIKEKERLAQEVLPTLDALYREHREEAIGEVHKGKQGIKAVFESILKERQEWLVLGGSGKGIRTLPYYLPHFYDELYRNRIRTRILFVDTPDTREQAAELQRYDTISTKFLPKSIRNLMVTFIFADYVFNIPITQTTEVKPFGLLIKSKEIAEGQRDYFNWLWSLC